MYVLQRTIGSIESGPMQLRLGSQHVSRDSDGTQVPATAHLIGLLRVERRQSHTQLNSGRYFPTESTLRYAFPFTSNANRHWRRKHDFSVRHCIKGSPQPSLSTAEL